jgi:GNAT superfamily N-acetyltransferase
MSSTTAAQNKRSWTVRLARPGDAGRIAELFETVFGLSRSVAHTTWKFDQNPAGAPVVVVAEDGDRIVGQYALWPTPLRLGGTSVLGAQSLETMTHPDYRGQGMFTVLANESFIAAADRGVEVLYGFPNSNSFHGFVRRLNWDHTGDVGLWVHPLHLGLHHRVPAALKPLAEVLGAIWLSGNSRGFELSYSPEPPSELAALVAQSTFGKDSCSIDRSPSWLQWRYSPAAGANYEWATARRAGGEVVAAVVWGADLRNRNAVFVDFLGADSAGLRAATAAALRRAHAGRHSLATALAQHPAAERALRACGFIRAGRLPLIVRNLTARTLGANIHDHAAWRIIGGDVDTQ